MLEILDRDVFRVKATVYTSYQRVDFGAAGQNTLVNPAEMTFYVEASCAEKALQQLKIWYLREFMYALSEKDAEKEKELRAMDFNNVIQVDSIVRLDGYAKTL